MSVELEPLPIAELASTRSDRGPNIRARIAELGMLRAGWLDGTGAAPNPAALDGTAAAFDDHYPDDLRLPYLFPTPDGRLLAEWALPPCVLSLEIDPVAMRGTWHALNLDTDAESERDLDLGRADAWTWLAEQVRTAGGVAE